MKMFAQISIVTLILTALLVAGVFIGINAALEESRQQIRHQKMEKIIRDALYGSQELDPVALKNGEFVWYYPHKMRVERINETTYKIIMPKQMSQVQERLAEL